MNLLRITAVAVLAALATACASTPRTAAPAPPTETLVVGESASETAPAAPIPARNPRRSNA
jgi:phospholipid-binding lipoprotein MlaA